RQGGEPQHAVHPARAGPGGDRFRQDRPGQLARAVLTGGILRIDDPADPRGEPYVAVRERDLVGRRGEFIAEGEVVLRVLLGGASRCRASSILVAENRLEG